MDETSGWLICQRTSRRWVVGPDHDARIEFDLDGSRRTAVLRDIGQDGVFFETPSDLVGLVRDKRIEDVTIRHETGEIHGTVVVRHVTSGIGAPRGCGAIFKPAEQRDREALKAFLRCLDADHAPVVGDEAADEQPVLSRPGERRVRVQTIHGAIEGTLPVGEGASTMHRLNMVASTQRLLRLEPPVKCTPECVFHSGHLSVVIDSIVFVTEVAQCVPTPKEPQAAARFRRVCVTLLLRDYVVEGFVHVPPGGDAIVRLNQDRHKFLALTSVTVRSAEGEFSVPFMALNSSELLAIQETEFEGAQEDTPVAVAQ